MRNGKPTGSGREIVLVLDAGGVLGTAWLLGALQALWSETGWSPAGADLVVGTSAGAIVATLVGAHKWPRTDPLDESALIAVREAAARVPQVSLRSFLPGSWPLVRAAWRAGKPGQVLGGLLPGGLFSTEPIQRFVRAALPEGWPARPELWIAATDHVSGKQRVFSAGPDSVPVEAAVAASCSVPGFYRPVSINGRPYVDGAVAAPSGLRLARNLGARMVICLNPGASPLRGGTLLARQRRWLHQWLRREADDLETRGTRVFLLEPGMADSRLIGLAPMADRRATAVGRAAFLHTAEAIRGSELAAALAA